MKQEWTMRIFKEDRRLTQVSKYGSRNQVGWRCVGTYEFDGRDELDMVREVRKLKPLYPEPKFKFEWEPTYTTVKSLMTGADVRILTSERGGVLDPSTERHWM